MQSFFRTRTKKRSMLVFLFSSVFKGATYDKRRRLANLDTRLCQWGNAAVFVAQHARICAKVTEKEHGSNTTMYTYTLAEPNRPCRIIPDITSYLKMLDTRTSASCQRKGTKEERKERVLTRRGGGLSGDTEKKETCMQCKIPVAIDYPRGVS